MNSILLVRPEVVTRPRFAVRRTAIPPLQLPALMLRAEMGLCAPVRGVRAKASSGGSFGFFSHGFRRLLLPLLLLALTHAFASDSICFEQSARSVARYDFVEVTLKLAQPHAGNPFTDAEFTGEFGPVSGTLTKVDGFCDSEDGSVFRIRFMPSQAGRHEYRVRFHWGATTTEHRGEFTAHSGSRKGIVRVDPEHPTHFLWEGTGQHFFYNSTTAYWLLGWRDDAIIRESLDRLARLKVNRIRVALNGRTYDGKRWGEPDVAANEAFQFRLAPWPAARPDNLEHPGYDVMRFNLAHFRKAERMLAHALRRDVVVSLIFHLDGEDKGVDPFGKSGMGGPDEQRYYRYCVARFGAFANIMWDVTNEWHLFRDQAWVEKMGALIKDADPYDHCTTVHGHGQFPFRNSPWCDFAIFQSWDEHGAYDFMLKNRREQAATGRLMPQVNEEYGYEDHYPYPWGEKRVWPARIGEERVRRAWEMTMAGGYQTTGERANQPGYGGWLTGRGNDAMTMLPGYARMREFFERFEWWKLEPRPELVSPNALCLAELGRRYVVYLPNGGSATLRVANEKYEIRQFDPRSGKSTRLPASTTNEWISPRLPKNQTCVFLLEHY